MNFGFIVDNRKCIGCHACTVACKSEHRVPVGVNRTWVQYIEKGRFPSTRRLFSVMRCNHCENAPCVEICPVTALYTRADGIVDFDNRRCIGCKSCMQACPYDALYIDPDTHTAAKCNYCAHRVDIGLEPACVNICPEHAIISGDMDNPLTEIAMLLAREQVTARKVEKGTRPNLFYINGDESYLKPGQATDLDTHLWSEQTSGVGHFAKYAEERIAQSDPVELAARLTHPENRSQEQPGASSNLNESASKIYDSPGKGILWGWEVSGYVWTKGIAAGAFLVPFIAKVLNLAPVSASVQWDGVAFGLIFLILTGALLIMDLDRPARFLYVLLRPQWRSWLVRGGYAISIYGFFLVAWSASAILGWERLRMIATWGGAIFAVFTAVYTAFLFAQARGRDFWQSPVLFLHMLTHAFIAGSSVFAVNALFTSFENDWAGFIRLVLGLGILFNLLIIMLELMTGHATVDAEKTVRMIVSGRYKRVFWGVCILLGNVLPLALVFSGGDSTMGGAGLLALIGVLFTEHIWLQAPQRVPLS